MCIGTVNNPMSFDLVLFGGTGDLAWRKLMPALFRPTSCYEELDCKKLRELLHDTEQWHLDIPATLL